MTDPSPVPAALHPDRPPARPPVMDPAAEQGRCAAGGRTEAPGLIPAASDVVPPLGLVVVGISGESAESQGKRGILSPEQASRAAEVDALLTSWRADLRAALERRARRAEREGRETSAKWYSSRAATLASPWTGRVNACGDISALVTTCPDCGTVEERPLLCGLRLWCPDCADVRRRREYARLMRSLGQRTREARAAWYHAGRPRHEAPQLRLLTLTVRHAPGDVATAREAISRAWPRLRRWLLDEVGYSPAYAATWEVSQSGHAHLHVCAVLPFLDLAGAAEAWVRATHGEAAGQGLDLRTVRTTEAARYVAGYVAAPVLSLGLPAEVAAAWVRASYARRLVHASRAFWVLIPRAACDCGSVACRQTGLRRLYGETSRARAPPDGAIVDA